MLGQAAGRGMGAYMVVELGDDQEIRRAKPAYSGRKRVTYAVNLHLFHLAHIAHAEDAEADVNGLIEAVKTYFRGDITLGQICYQAGESPNGLKTKVTPSMVDKEIVGTYVRITFDAEVQIIA